MTAKRAKRKRRAKSPRKTGPVRAKKAPSAKVLGALRRELIQRAPEDPDQYLPAVPRREV